MSEPEITPAASRRAVFAGAGVAAAAVVVAGCSSGNGSSSNAGAGATSASAPAATGGAGSSAAGGASGTLAATSDIPVDGGTVFKDRKIVITQPASGTFKAFTAVCTHMGCTVGSVSGGTINCPCHGSKYSITDGSVVNGPAPKPLAPIAIKVDGSSIVAG
jgi:Rieske Fe-S protein